jgi:hypothetical protein
MLADALIPIPWQQMIYVAGGLFGLIGVAGMVLGVVDKGRKLFGRGPALQASFASRQDLRDQDQLLKQEMRLLGARLEQQIGDAEVGHSRAIGALHEKINKVAEDTAYLRGKIEERLL